MTGDTFCHSKLVLRSACLLIQLLCVQKECLLITGSAVFEILLMVCPVIAFNGFDYSVFNKVYEIIYTIYTIANIRQLLL